MGFVTGLIYPEQLEVGTTVRVIAQVRRGPSWVYMRRGSPVAVLDRFWPRDSEIVPGSIVSGTVLRVLERSVLIKPTELAPPVLVKGIRAEQSVSQPKPIGRMEDGRIVLFDESSPLTGDIRPGDIASGTVVQETETYVVMLPTSREPLPPKEREIAEERALSQGAYPPIHPFVPWVLNELVPASIGSLRPEIVGLVGATQVWQAFEDLVTASFRILDFGEVKPLGWHKTRQTYPDGYVFCPSMREKDYLLAYDAKKRSDTGGYGHNVDDVRAFEDYLRSAPYAPRFRKRGIVVVAHAFRKDPPSIRDGTVTYLPSKLLARLATMKVMNETLISHEVLEPLLLRGTIVDDEDLRDWEEHHNLRELTFE
jgi:hypothetical protein